MGATAARSREAGFTLLEVLIALVILGLAATAGALALPNLSARSAVHGFAGETGHLLRAARNEAIRSGAPVTVRLVEGARAIEVPRLGRTLPIPDGISVTLEGTIGMDGSARRGASVLFLGDGSSTGGIVRIAQGDQIAVRRIAWLTGRIDDAP